MYKKSVARWFANEDNLRQFCAECAEMTDENYHTERQILIAHKFGFKELERKLRNLDAVHTDMGGLCGDLAIWRNELRKIGSYGTAIYIIFASIFFVIFFIVR